MSISQHCNSSAERSLGQRILVEPLFHFVIVAALLFGLQAWVQDDEREVIVVDVSAQEFLIEQKEELLQRPLSETEKRDVINAYVDDEILVREARNRGFGDGGRIRTLLLQNMRFFIAGDIPQASEQELRVFFEANRDEFAVPETIDLEQRMFQDSSQVPADYLIGLRSAPNIDSTEATFNSSYPRNIKNVNMPRLAQAFGGENAKEIWASKDGTWLGPLTSPQGSVHFLRISARHPVQFPDYDEVRDWLENQWVSAQSQELVEAELTRLRPNFRIEILSDGSADNE